VAVKVPRYPWTLMLKTYGVVLPTVHRYLSAWKERARGIPDPELRKQALMSIETKTFHCEGGAIYGLLARDMRDEAIRFIVAYQTVSDYLDNLCDRSTSQDPEDFRVLHESMFHALKPGEKPRNYYHHRREKADGGYLVALVRTCQEVIAKVPAYEVIAPALAELAGYYCDLQVLKHIRVEERIPRLQAWFDRYKMQLPEMQWYEFCACAGSTLGIFCLVSSAMNNGFSRDLTDQVKEGFFPWVQGLHILLDYFIDQEEDRLGGDLNFCFYYDSDEALVERFVHFVNEADDSISELPHARFHRMINRGLLGLYLADNKVKGQKRMREMARKIGRQGGMLSFFVYLNCWLYQWLRG
jgi:tetraprenyl-beta-curcumene synthase